MKTRHVLLDLILSVLLCLSAPPAPAEQVVRAWTTLPWSWTTDDRHALSVDAADGSLWLVICKGSAGDNLVLHLDRRGRELWRGQDFNHPHAISVNSSDHSCWIASWSEVVHIAQDGTELWRRDGFENIYSLAVDSRNGSCWIADAGWWEPEADEPTYSALVHLAADGRELWRRTGWNGLFSVAVDQRDGSCWATDRNNAKVVHFSADHRELSRTEGFANTVSVNSSDGSCWAGANYKPILHIASDGTFIWRSSDSYALFPGSVNSSDGSLWVVDNWQDLIHLASDGSVLWQHEYVFSAFDDLCVDPSDGSCWASGWLFGPGPALRKYTADGTELWHRERFPDPLSVSVNPTDGSCWVGRESRAAGAARLREDCYEVTRFGPGERVAVNSSDGSCWISWSPNLRHVAADGTVLTEFFSFGLVSDLSVNPTDGSCWVADTWRLEVVKLAADGTELARVGGFTLPWSVSVNPTDGSCWVADTDADEIIHLAEDGSELWRGGFISLARGLSVNPSDGSCWVADLGTREVVHLAEDGTELWREGGFGEPVSISVNSTDGSCWVADLGTGEVVHLAEDGTELWREGGFGEPVSISVNSTDGSCWVADRENDIVVHLMIVAFPDVMPAHWAYHAVRACANAGIVGGYDDGLYHGDWPVDRGQMAVYIARALAEGEDYVPTGPAEATFEDVPTDYWAYDHVEYCYDENVVQGYTATTYEPTLQVTRDQMAVYVARAMVAPTGEAALADYVPADPRDFPDVPSTGYGDDGTDPFWAYTHIEYCVENGVVSGYDDGYYRPEWVVTRDQMAVYVARAFGLVG